MKNWTNTPPFETQYSASTHTDAMDCVEESLNHIIYMLNARRYSPRALGFVVNVQPWGSNTINAIRAAEARGLVPYELWQTPDTFTWESYYADIPTEILNFNDLYQINIIPPDLDKSPLWTELLFPNGARHMVAQINETEYFDSELGSPIKPLDYGGAKVVSQVSISINPVNVNDWYVKSTGFSAEQFASFTPEVQQAIKANDRGAHNIISQGKILYKDPNFVMA